MANTERPILTEEYVRKLFGENLGIMAEAELVETAKERDAVDREQAKTGRPLILIGK